uniref:Anhydro-N-acetylmuramic acid kinase n=1 Tax=Solibacter usitatus (strain Ellin6076) TaxID=234267 RepID=Q01X97_SOLUE
MKIAGVMSGTSLDGIDVAIVEIKGRQVNTLGFTSAAYPAAVRAAILEVSNAITTTAAISQLNFQLGELYARAIRRAIARFGPVELIGCHGQTIYHEGRGNTMQIGEAAVVAERTGVPVISNFRVRDIAAGGQGAPLVPYFDYLLFRHPRRTRIALNIGGIGNITVIPAGAAPGDVIAFDTGPGNMVIDALAREYTKGKSNCDRGGKIAASGKVATALLNELLQDSYYKRKPPKSAGREQYGAEFIAGLKATGLPLRDLITTVTVFTAATIAIGVQPWAAGATDLIASGGGVHNPEIMAHLAGFLPGVDISTSSDHGINVDAKEAIAFAVLAYETWRRKPSNLPSATGAKHGVVLGTITP